MRKGLLPFAVCATVNLWRSEAGRKFMRVHDVALFTHRGAVRARNEDAVFAGGTIFQQDLRDVITLRLTGSPHALLIADGIGGQPQGDFASRAALTFLKSQNGLLDGPATCETALHAANERLYELMDEPGRIGMGTTIAGLVLQETAMIAFNVGDSRAYRLSGGGLHKLSHEDVMLPPGGGMAPARTHGITQALGGSTFPLAIVPHVCVEPPLQVGDKVLLCTDGLTDALNDTEIETFLQLSASPAIIIQKLVRRAISAGTRDNISVVVGVGV